MGTLAVARQRKRAEELLASWTEATPRVRFRVTMRGPSAPSAYILLALQVFTELILTIEAF